MDVDNRGAAVLRRHASARVAWLLVACGALVIACAFSVALGVRLVPLGEALDALTGDTDTIAAAAVRKRIPRTVMAVIIGAALSTSGATMQAITRNPIAEPGILGVSGGAALAVVVGISFAGLANPYGIAFVALVGAGVSAVFVYTVGSLGRGGATPLKLALAGAATSAAMASLVSAILLPRVDIMFNFQFWQIGGVGSASWDRIGVVAPFLMAGGLVCFVSARGLNSLALGDELAVGLGENIVRTRLVASAGAVVLAGASTSAVGPIAFVGLVVPHLARLLVGTDHRWMLPLCAVGGAALLVTADVVGRVIARPGEVQVGIVVAMIGAPVLIWLVRGQTVREL